ncbi:MAG: phosphate signaling complex protein PhoU [Christensenellales bacterium]
MRLHFDEQLHLLNEEMIRMGSMIERAIENAGQVLETRDQEACRAIMAYDNEIDRQERDIETMCLRLILMQQPVARDLRLISAALKMITDMERIGDHAADIAEILTMPSTEPPVPMPPMLKSMSVEASKMVRRAIDAFVRRDVSLAHEVIRADDIVDDLFMQVRNELIVMIRDHPDSSMHLLDILMFAKYFERIGDHAVNIAEWVEYAVTGVYKGDKLQ